MVISPIESFYSVLTQCDI